MFGEPMKRDQSIQADLRDSEVLSPLNPGEILLGTLTEIDPLGQPWVSYLHGSMRGAALSTVAVAQEHIGRTVALLFAGGDLRQPIVIGFIRSTFEALLTQPAARAAHAAGDALEQDPGAPGVEFAELDVTLNPTAALDDATVERQVIEAREELVFRCGESSITLTKAGKITIQGKYLVSRSSGVNRILGGSVDIN